MSVSVPVFVALSLSLSVNVSVRMSVGLSECVCVSLECLGVSLYTDIYLGVQALFLSLGVSRLNEQ